MVAAIAGGLVALGALTFTLLSARSKRRFSSVEAAWKQYAEAKGMRFTRAMWSRSSKATPPSIEAEVQGVPVYITLQMTERGPMTRVEATLPSVAEDFLFAIYRRNSLTKLPAELSDVSEAITGNKVF